MIEIFDQKVYDLLSLGKKELTLRKEIIYKFLSIQIKL